MYILIIITLVVPPWLPLPTKEASGHRQRLLERIGLVVAWALQAEAIGIIGDGG